MKLCCDPETRLGKNGADEIKAHNYFDGIDFDPDIGLRKLAAPYVPKIASAVDTSNFDAIDEDKLHSMNEHNDNNGQSNGLSKHKNHIKDYYNNSSDHGKHPDHAFFEFTFRRFFDDGGHPYPMRLENDKDCNGQSGHGGLVNGNHVNAQPNETNQGSPVYV